MWPLGLVGKKGCCIYVVQCLPAPLFEAILEESLGPFARKAVPETSHLSLRGAVCHAHFFRLARACDQKVPAPFSVPRGCDLRLVPDASEGTLKVVDLPLGP